MIPTKTKQKYLHRLNELIEKGQDVTVRTKTIGGRPSFVTGERSFKEVNNVDWPQFVEWRTNCITLLDNVIPSNSIHRATVDNFGSLKNQKDHLEFGISFLKSIRDDFENGYLDNLYLEIEAELSVDYMSQANALLKAGISGKYEYVPAAVLSGAILEKALRTLCNHLTPPEPIINKNAKPLMLTALIENLKKRNVFNEIVAKQLRTWAGIRNSAAHGEFEEFNKKQVESMVTGIESFLAQYLS
jgi:hypothetical protein